MAFILALIIGSALGVFAALNQNRALIMPW
jgi:ABC-type dipeptide/oligopeptide/nickel transport system permease component